MISFVLVTTGACLVTLSSRQPSLPTEEVTCCLGPFLSISGGFQPKAYCETIYPEERGKMHQRRSCFQ